MGTWNENTFDLFLETQKKKDIVQYMRKRELKHLASSLLGIERGDLVITLPHKFKIYLFPEKWQIAKAGMRAW